MTENIQVAPSYIASLLKPNGSKHTGRKVWSIDLETVWLPFFLATNTEGLTLLPHESLGAPLRLAYDKDGMPKFSDKTHKPVIKVVKEVGEAVRLVRENLSANLVSYAQQVRKLKGEAYNAELQACFEAGKPIVEKDKQAIQQAIDKAMAQAMAESAGKETEVKEAVTV